MARSRGDDRTLDLLAWEPPAVTVGYSGEVSGRGQLDNRIARLVSRALRDARDGGKARGEVAEAMSRYLGRKISAQMLDKWSSEGSEEHRIPLDAFAALIEATGCDDLLGFLPALFGYVVMPERYRDIVELHLVAEHRSEIEAREAALRARVRGRR